MARAKLCMGLHLAVWLHDVPELDLQGILLGRGRNQARALFNSATFPGAPLQSRTVEFPESGFDLEFLLHHIAFQHNPKLK